MMVFCIFLEGRYVPIQISGFDYQYFDLPLIITRIKNKVHTRLVAVEISKLNDGSTKIQYIAEKD